jgi:hypothetical protein
MYVRPGKLGIVIAKEPAPQALPEQRRNDLKRCGPLRAKRRKLTLRLTDGVPGRSCPESLAVQAVER